MSTVPPVALQENATPVMGFPFWSDAVAVNVCACPVARFAGFGVTATDVRTGVPPPPLDDTASSTASAAIP